MDVFSVDTILSSLGDTSMIHWLSLYFGDWVRLVVDSEATVNEPISALMVAVSSCNIIALIGVLLVIVFTGLQSIMNGLLSVSLMQGMSDMVALRIILSMSLLMPTNYGADALEKGNFEVRISYSQAMIMKVFIISSGIADWVWINSVRGLINFNISGGTSVYNSLTQTKEFADGFLCNAIYLGKRNRPLRYDVVEYNSINMMVTSQTMSSISSLRSFLKPSGYSKTLEVSLGHLGSCGSFTIDVPRQPSNSSASNFNSMNELIGVVGQGVHEEVSNVIVDYLSNLESYAVNYANVALNSNMTMDSITADLKNDNFKFYQSNPNSVSVSGGSSEAFLNSLSDSLLYIAQKKSYDSVDIGCRGFNSSTGSNLCVPKYSKPKKHSDDKPLMDDEFVMETFGKYISAGMMWNSLQELTTTLATGSRKLNNFKYKKGTPREEDICNDYFGNIFNKVKNAFKSSDLPMYLCDAHAHVVNGNDKVFEAMGKKINKVKVPQNIPTIGGGTSSISLKLWKNYYDTSSSESNQINVNDENTIGLFGRAIFEVIEKGWWFSENEPSMASSRIASGRRSLTGHDGMFFDISGELSPYTFLTTFGEGMRDIYFTVEATKLLIKSLMSASDLTAKSMANILDENSAGISAPITWTMRFVTALAKGTLERIIDLLSGLSTALFAASLIVIYILPSIPMVGWIFVILGLLFVAFSSMVAIPFTSVLVALPKGQDALNPDTERVLSLIYGIFIRQPLTVIGFIGSLITGYVGMALVNYTWFRGTLQNISEQGFIDQVFQIVFVVVGYGIILFFVCLYSFRVTTHIVDTVGVWFSSTFAGGAFGGSMENDVQATRMGMQQLSGKLDAVASSFGDNPNKTPPKGNTPPKDQKRANA